MDKQDDQKEPNVVPKVEKSTEDGPAGHSSNASNSVTYRKIRSKRALKKQIWKRVNAVGLDDYDHFLNNPDQWSDYDPGEITKFINDFARKSQTVAESENKKLESYHKLAHLLAPSKDTPVSCQPKNEIALAIDAIAHLEPSFVTDVRGTVNLNMIYHNIATFMKGEPQELGRYRAGNI